MSIETPEQLEGLRRAGAVVAEVLRVLEAAVRPRVTTGELDALAAETMAAHGARSGPIITYRYPGAVCLSVDDEVVPAPPRLDVQHQATSSGSGDATGTGPVVSRS